MRLALSRLLRAAGSRYQNLGNVSGLVIARLFKTIGGFAIALLMARHLGPEKFGALSYAIAFISLFNVFTRLGLNNVATRFLAENNYPEQLVLSSCFLLKLIAGFLGYGIACVISYLTQSETTQVLIYILGLTFVFQCLETPEYWFNARLKSKVLASAYTVNVTVGLLAISLCIFTTQPLWVFAAALAFQTISGFSVLSLTYWLATKVKSLDFKICRHLMLKLFKDSYPLMLSGFAIIAYMRIDQIMIQAMIGSEAVGIYAIASNFSESWYFVPVAITQAFLPIAVRYRAEGNIRAYYQLLHRLFRYLFFLSFIISILITVVASKLIVFSAGEDYQQSAIILTVHVWGGIFVCFGLVRGLWIIAENRPDLTLKTTIMGGVLNIILNAFTIKIYGPVGAAVSTVIARFLAAMASNLLFQPLQPILALQVYSVLAPKRIHHIHSKLQ